MVTGTPYSTSNATLQAGLYLAFLIFIPTYSSSGTTTFTNFSVAMGGTNVTSITGFSDGNITRQTMAFGVGSSYPYINFGPIIFSVSALSSNVTLQVTPTFTFTTYAAGINPSSNYTYVRIA